MLEHIGDIISMVGSAVSSVVLPILGVMLFYDAKKRKEYAEARKAEADNITQYAAEWKELYEKKEHRVNELEAKIEKLYGQIGDDRQRIRELQEKVSALVQENQALKFKECQVRGCKDRQPPSDY